MFNSYQFHRLLLFVAVVAGFGLFWLAGGSFHVPLFAGHEPSLLQMPAAGTRLLVVTLTLFIATALCSVIVGRVRFEAGWFAAVLGMSALSVRAGPMGETLRAAANVSPTPGVFLLLAGELVALFALVGLAWAAVWFLHRGERLPKWLPALVADDFREGVEGDESMIADKFAALGIAVVVSGVALMLLARSDAKAQVLIAVMLASYLGAMAAYAVYPVTPSAWYWAAPLIVGLVGYVGGRYGVDVGWRVGNPQWMLAPLARPAPLDYASVGPAGALLGYWMARRMHQDRIDEATAANQAAAEFDPAASA